MSESRFTHSVQSDGTGRPAGKAKIQLTISVSGVSDNNGSCTGSEAMEPFERSADCATTFSTSPRNTRQLVCVILHSPGELYGPDILHPPRDNEGYLLDPDTWTVQIAGEIAQEEDIELSDEHWLIIRFIRDYYDSNQTVAETRVLLKYLKQTLDKDRSTRRYLYSLFPYGYGQQACKIAGMRKPLKLMLDV